MVTYKNLSRFYARTSGGKYQLDLHEIRAGFLAADGGFESMTLPSSCRISSLPLATMKSAQSERSEIRELREKVAQLKGLRMATAEVKAKQARFETLAARLEFLDGKLNLPVQA